HLVFTAGDTLHLHDLAATDLQQARRAFELCYWAGFFLCFHNLFVISRLDWWRRRESNPRPKMLLVKRLHAYSRSCPWHYPKTFATAAQNGQETVAASLRS